MTATGRSEISEREAEVLAALGAGWSNAQIASSMHISVRTVESHVSSLLRKYGVADRKVLATIADLAEQAPAGVPAPGRIAGLPVAWTTFVGRAHECDSVLAALRDTRLVTLVGPGGVGKTRLAAVVAAAANQSFPFGGAFVDLVPVRDGFVAQAVAAVLGVTERADQPLEEVIVERLASGRWLIVLDNCEHLLDAVAAFANRVLSGCPATTILATSRERLSVPGERVVPVSPLPLSSDAEALFHDRAAAADPGFQEDSAVIAELCARLDGMPLAIELAAARTASLGVAGLLSGLDDHLRLLAGGRGSDQRHRSLRAVLGWSYDLLDDEESALFRRLAVFVGGFNLNAVAAVTGASTRGAVADVLGRLVDKSLVVHRRGGPGTWRLLETVRAFALDQLEASGERAAIVDRHLHWAAAQTAELDARLGADKHGKPGPTDGADKHGKPGPTDGADKHGKPGPTDGAGWRGDFDEVVDDLRAALAGAEAGVNPTAHRLARALGHLTYARRFLNESLGHYRTAARHAATPIEAARDLIGAADVAQALTVSGDAFDLLLAAAERARAGGDGRAEAFALAQAVTTAGRFPAAFAAPVPRERLSALLDQAVAAGDPDDAVVSALVLAARAWNAGGRIGEPDPELSRAAVAAARRTGDPILICASLDAVSAAATVAGRYREAHRLASERLELIGRMDRADPAAAAEILDTVHIAESRAISAGDLPAALSTATMVLRDDLVGAEPYRSTSKIIPPLALMGRLHEAIDHGREMWDGWERAGAPVATWMSRAVSAVALAYGLLGDAANLALWRDRATGMAGADRPSHSRNLASSAAFAVFVDARVANHAGDLAGAAELVERAFADFSSGWYQAYARAAAAELAVLAGLPDAAERLALATAAAAENDWAAACVARANGRLHRDRDALTASIEGWERIDARFERACTLLLIPERAAEGRDELARLGGLPGR